MTPWLSEDYILLSEDDFLLSGDDFLLLSDGGVTEAGRRPAEPKMVDRWPQRGVASDPL